MKSETWKRYRLGDALVDFCKVMMANEHILTDDQKENIVLLDAGAKFKGFRRPIYARRMYSTSFCPWIAQNNGNFTADMLAAQRVLQIAHDIAYCEGLTSKERYSLTNGELFEIANAFLAAERGDFIRPSFFPEWVDDCDKMKAYADALLTDINYHYEDKMLFANPSSFAAWVRGGRE